MKEISRNKLGPLKEEKPFKIKGESKTTGKIVVHIALENNTKIKKWLKHTLIQGQKEISFSLVRETTTWDRYMIDISVS